MYVLTKENITEYLKKHMPDLDDSKPLVITAVGEGTAEEDGDGYLNFIYRVSDGKYNLILKQGRSEGRVALFQNLSAERNRLEYEYMKLCQSIVPDFVPKLYFYDVENRIFATEDVSYLQIARFQLNKSKMFPKMAEQAAEFLAKMHFYTSDYYLDTGTFRKLKMHFNNHKMRSIFDEMMFLSYAYGTDGELFQIREELDPYVRNIVLDSDVVLERYKLRDLYMNKSEALIHGDFHTSNLFVGMEELKVIDMEYVFCGPMAFDVGYLEGHLLSQFICAGFREYETEDKQKEFQAYVLASMQKLFEHYCSCFFACWEKDAKKIYQGVEGLKENVKNNLLKDMIGFCASTHMYRCTSVVDYPEYDVLSPENKLHAVILSVMMDRQMLSKREQYQSVEEFVDDMLQMEQIYRKEYQKR